MTDRPLTDDYSIFQDAIATRHYSISPARRPTSSTWAVQSSGADMRWPSAKVTERGTQAE
jgi:hypothetical protein